MTKRRKKNLCYYCKAALKEGEIAECAKCNKIWWNARRTFLFDVQNILENGLRLTKKLTDKEL